MTKILILGGTGYTGKPLARLLLQHSEASITLAARHLEKAQALADEFNHQFPGGRTSAVYADAADGNSLQAAFQDQDLILVASPTTAQAEAVTNAALEVGADYLDVQLGARKFALLQALSAKVSDSGRCFITEAGFHPGLPAALVRYAASCMDTLTSANVISFLNVGSSFPYTEAMDELVEMFKGYQAQVYKAGSWTRRSSFSVRQFDLGGDIGKKQCYSMFFEELQALPEMHPSLQELGSYISESHWVTDWILYPFIWAWLMVMPRAVRPIGRLTWWGMKTFHHPPYRVEMQVQAGGLKAGKPVRLTAAASHPDGYMLTAVPVAAALLQYLDGSARKPGLWMMGHLCEPVRLLADMARMGVRVTTSIE